MTQTVDYLELFNNSFESAVTPREGQFYDAFYRQFFSASDQIAAMFSHTDMSRQKRVLHESIVLMIAFFCNKRASPRLQDVARRHGPAGLNVPAELYDLWLHALLDTVETFDPHYNHDTAMAWRVVLAPGIAFMQHFNSEERKEARLS